MRKSKMKHYQPPLQTSQQGVVLLEALIAILIFSMGLLALAGLQTAMVKNTSDAKYRVDAAFIAQQHLGKMWAAPNDLAGNLAANKDIATLPNGKLTVTLPAVGGEVKVEVKWQLPGQDEHNYTTYARITGGD